MVPNRIFISGGISLVVQWLGLRASTTGGMGSILVGELGSQMQWEVAKK